MANFNRTYDYAAFVRHWTAAATLTEAAERTGLDLRRTTQLANYLRRKGVKLKRFPRGGNRGYVSSWPEELKQLNELASARGVRRTP